MAVPNPVLFLFCLAMAIYLLVVFIYMERLADRVLEVRKWLPTVWKGSLVYWTAIWGVAALLLAH